MKFVSNANSNWNYIFGGSLKCTLFSSEFRQRTTYSLFYSGDPWTWLFGRPSVPELSFADKVGKLQLKCYQQTRINERDRFSNWKIVVVVTVAPSSHTTMPSHYRAILTNTTIHNSARVCVCVINTFHGRFARELFALMDCAQP